MAAKHFSLTVAPSSPHKGTLSGFMLLQSAYLDISPLKKLAKWTIKTKIKNQNLKQTLQLHGDVHHVAAE